MESRWRRRDLDFGCQTATAAALSVIGRLDRPFFQSAR